MGNTLDYGISLKCKNPSKVYICGELIEGDVIVTLPGKRKIPPGSLKLTLATNLRYYTDLSPRIENTTVQPLSIYHFPVRIREQTGGSISLKAVRNVLPFAFEIPPNLPAQIYCQHGIPIISHTLWATLDRASVDGKPRSSNPVQSCVRDSVNLIIYPRVSILANPDLLKPHSTCGNRTYIHLELSLEQTAFVPGQVIAAHIKINNKNRHTIKSCTASLIQEYAAYTVRGQRKMLEVSQFDATRSRSDEIIDEYCSLTIPHRALQPSHTYVGGTRNRFSVSVGYRIEVHVNVKGLFNPSIIASQPILIGTEPTVHEMTRQWLETSRRRTTDPSNELYPVIETSDGPPSYSSIYPEASAPPASKADES